MEKFTQNSLTNKLLWICSLGQARNKASFFSKDIQDWPAFGPSAKSRAPNCEKIKAPNLINQILPLVMPPNEFKGTVQNPPSCPVWPFEGSWTERLVFQSQMWLRGRDTRLVPQSPLTNQVSYCSMNFGMYLRVKCTSQFYSVIMNIGNLHDILCHRSSHFLQFSMLDSELVPSPGWSCDSAY